MVVVWLWCGFGVVVVVQGVVVVWLWCDCVAVVKMALKKAPYHRIIDYL